MKTLVIKLAGTVSDNTLPVLGELRLPVTMSMVNASNYAARKITLRATRNVTVQTDGVGYFCNDDYSGHLGTSMTFSGEKTLVLSLSSTEYNLIIKDKYALDRFVMNYAMYIGEWDLGWFSDMVNLSRLIINNSRANLKGDLADLSLLRNLLYLQIQGQSELTGNISSLASLTSAQFIAFSAGEVNVANSHITGNTSSLASLYPTLETFNKSALTNVTGEWPPA